MAIYEADPIVFDGKGNAVKCGGPIKIKEASD